MKIDRGFDTVVTILVGMGFDPARKHRRTAFDYWFVGGSILAGVALILWVLFG